MADLTKAMSEVADMHKKHGVMQKGNKKYTQVVHRMEAFRKVHGTEFGVNTKILVDDGKRVVIKAVITDKEGRVIGSGMAEEIRGQGHVNTTSALENGETSSIGRALASLGLSGGEYASANELETAKRNADNLDESSSNTDEGSEDPTDTEEEKPGAAVESNSSADDLPPQPSWDQVISKINKDIDLIKNKKYSIDIRQKARLNDLRGLYPKVKEKFGDNERWDEVHQIFKVAQSALERD